MTTSCGHDHAPDLDHGSFPPPSRITAVVYVPHTSAYCAASTPLRAPWGQPNGEVALHRVLRLLHGEHIHRIFTILPTPNHPLSTTASKLSTLLHLPSPPSLARITQTASTIALQVPSPPDALLLWDASAPLIDPKTLHSLLTNAHPALALPEHPWVRTFARDHRNTALSTPCLLSRRCAEHLRTPPNTDDHTTLRDLLATLTPLTQRILTQDPFTSTRIDALASAMPYTHKTTPHPKDL